MESFHLIIFVPTRKSICYTWLITNVLFKKFYEWRPVIIHCKFTVRFQLIQLLWLYSLLQLWLIWYISKFKQILYLCILESIRPFPMVRWVFTFKMVCISLVMKSLWHKNNHYILLLKSYVSHISDVFPVLSRFCLSF